MARSTRSRATTAPASPTKRSPSPTDVPLDDDDVSMADEDNDVNSVGDDDDADDNENLDSQNESAHSSQPSTPAHDRKGDVDRPEGEDTANVSGQDGTDADVSDAGSAMEDFNREPESQAQSSSGTPRGSTSGRRGRRARGGSSSVVTVATREQQAALSESQQANVTPFKRKRGRPYGGGTPGRGRGRGRGAHLVSSVTRVPIDKQGTLAEVTDDEVVIPGDPEGETKVDKNGHLLGGREYRVRTFTIIGRAERLYMLSTEPARCTGFRDSYLFFTKHLRLFKIVLSDAEKHDLISRNLIPHSYKGRSIGVVTARSVFREFGARIIVGGRYIQDDYFVSEQQARIAAASEAVENNAPLDPAALPVPIEGELADPNDTIPPAGVDYNRNQYVAWLGASVIYHSNTAAAAAAAAGGPSAVAAAAAAAGGSGTMPPSTIGTPGAHTGGLTTPAHGSGPGSHLAPSSISAAVTAHTGSTFFKRTGGTGSHSTSINWQLEHARAASSFNSALISIRRLGWEEGVYDIHTNSVQWPANTQPLRSRWQPVLASEDDLGDGDRILDRFGGMDLSLDDQKKRPKVLENKDHQYRFSGVPAAVRRSYAVADTVFACGSTSEQRIPNVHVGGWQVSTQSHPIATNISIPDATDIHLDTIDEGINTDTDIDMTASMNEQNTNLTTSITKPILDGSQPVSTHGGVVSSPPVLPSSFTSMSAMTNPFLFTPGPLSSTPVDQIDLLPPECRLAFEQSVQREQEWGRQWVG